MAYDITVNITEAVIIGTSGFGTPLILASKATAAIPYTECTSLAQVATATGDTDNTIYKTAALLFSQNNAPDRIAIYAGTGKCTTELATIIRKDWRQLIAILGSEGDDTADKVADAIEETDNKLYFVTVSSSAELANVAEKNGVKRERTIPFFYDLKSGEELVEPYAVAALVGEAAGREAGSFTYKNLILKGLTPLDLTDEQIAEIHTGGGITFVTKAGDNVTTEGKTASGNYIDIIDSKDWIIQQIEYQAQRLLNTSDKLPYTNSGISALEGVVTNVLQQAYDNGMIATGTGGDDEGVPLYSVDFKGREEMSDTDRTNRIYTGGFFSFTLLGAIHTATINGELTI